MSAVSCLVLVLLCSFHACNARSFGVLVKKEPTQEFHSKRQLENDEKLNYTGVLIQHEKQYSSLPKVSEGAKMEDKSKEVIRVSSDHSEEHGNKDDTKAKAGDQIHVSDANKDDTKAKAGDQIHVSDAARNESLASVSWRVPDKKRGDPEPGFNLDYLPPKTHPPIHN